MAAQPFDDAAEQPSAADRENDRVRDSDLIKHLVHQGRVSAPYQGMIEGRHVQRAFASAKASAVWCVSSQTSPATVTSAS